MSTYHQCNKCWGYNGDHDFSQHPDEDRSYGYDKYTDPYWESDEYKAFVAAKIAKQEARFVEVRKETRRAARPEFSDIIAALLWIAGMAGAAWLLAWQMGLLDIL